MPGFTELEKQLGAYSERPASPHEGAMYIDKYRMVIRMFYDGRWMDIESANKAMDYMEKVKAREVDAEPPQQRFCEVAKELGEQASSNQK